MTVCYESYGQKSAYKIYGVKRDRYEIEMYKSIIS